MFFRRVSEYTWSGLPHVLVRLVPSKDHWYTRGSLLPSDSGTERGCAAASVHFRFEYLLPQPHRFLERLSRVHAEDNNEKVSWTRKNIVTHPLVFLNLRRSLSVNSSKSPIIEIHQTFLTICCKVQARRNILVYVRYDDCACLQFLFTYVIQSIIHVSKQYLRCYRCVYYY